MSLSVHESRYNPDVPSESEHSLAAHYVAFGQHEGRVPQRLRVVASYEAAAGLDAGIVFGGLCNQIYSHIGMLSIALQMGAEVVRVKLCLDSDPTAGSSNIGPV